mmetsp:Transcript_2516/g.4234  ORF Transcript_2516/g.4234 Transcript_2516/m.4234 type:complete len:108 (-) Transcript_2516:1162-1485(-)
MEVGINYSIIKLNEVRTEGMPQQEGRDHSLFFHYNDVSNEDFCKYSDDRSLSQDMMALANNCARHVRRVFLFEDNKYYESENFNEDLVERYSRQILYSFPEQKKRVE